MFKLRFLFGLVIFAFAFSCKAPTTSTSSTSTAEVVPPGASVTIPGNPINELVYPIWWVEESYAQNNRKASPTVVVFENNVSGYTVFGRTKPEDRLQSLGGFSTSGGNTNIAVKGLYFGVTDDGKWDNTIIYNGKKLTKGKPDFDSNAVIGLKGTHSALGTLNFPAHVKPNLPSNTKWMWVAELDGFQKLYVAVHQQAAYGTKIQGPTPIEQEKSASGYDRSYKIEASRFGDYIYLVQNPIPNNLPLHLLGHNMELILRYIQSGHLAGALAIDLKSTKNAHVYVLEKVDGTTDTYKWAVLAVQNNGGFAKNLEKP